MLDLLRRQRHATVIYAGDPYQAPQSHRSIFDDVVSHESAIGVFDLGQSWRMTQPIAGLAGRALSLVGVEGAIKGKADESGPMWDTRLAVIGRSTGVLVEKAAECAGFGVHWLGGCEGLGRLLSVYHQFAGRREHVQDGVVQNFASYDVLKDFALFAGDEDLLSLARVVERYGHDTPALAMEILDNAVQARAEQCAEVYVTAQQAKGHSWDRVLLAGDFDCTADGVDREDARQLYLAISRANREIEMTSAVKERLAMAAAT
jgi:hypothetical protein